MRNVEYSVVKQDFERLINLQNLFNWPWDMEKNIRLSEVVEDYARTGSIAQGCQWSVARNR